MTDSIVDDELTVTVRIRLADRVVLTTYADAVLKELPRSLIAAVRPLLSVPGMNLAGLEIALPTFTPIGTTGSGGGLTHEFTLEEAR